MTDFRSIHAMNRATRGSSAFLRRINQMMRADFDRMRMVEHRHERAFADANRREHQTFERDAEAERRRFERHVRAVEREIEGLMRGRHAGAPEPLLPLNERCFRSKSADAQADLPAR